jgi:predicted permease
VRLTSGATPEEANAELLALGPTGAAAGAEGAGVPVLEPVRSVLFPAGIPIMRLLLASALVLLVLACVNLAGLFLLRGYGRSHEVGVRLALGASRARIVRPVLVEVLVIVTTGAGLAIAGATVAFDAMLGQVPRIAYGNAPVGIDLRVALMTVGLCLLTGLGFAFAPAWRAWTHGVQPLVRTAAGRGSAPAWTFGRPLLATQVGMAVVLVFGAILAARAFVSILQTPLGFDATNVVAFTARLPQDADGPATFERMLRLVGSHPDVVAAGAMGQRPFDGSAPDEGVRRADPSEPLVGITHVLPGFDAAIGLPLVRGRSLAASDLHENPDVALVSESAARQLFGQLDPLGAVFDNGRGRTFRVVGVVADLRHSLDGTARDTAPSTYAFPPSGRARPLTLLVKTRVRSDAILRRLEEALETAVPGGSVTAGWWSDAISNVTAYRNPRFQTMVLATLAGAALGLTAFGVFGVVAFIVAARTRELGIRAAIGATPQSLVTLSVRHAILPVAAGTVLGLAGTRWAARFAEAQLFRMETRDPLMLLATAVVILLAAGAAAWLPARRAGRVDPVRVLRAE